MHQRSPSASSAACARLGPSGGCHAPLPSRSPEGGLAARDLAVSLQLPPEKIEGVFVNHVVHGLSVHVSPGDRVAFVPYGTPGPHRVFLGLYAADKEESEAAEGCRDGSG